MSRFPESEEVRTGAIAARSKLLRLSALSLAREMRAGAFKSIFKSRGVEFDGVREYERGDDVRMIDWNITARMNRPFVKLYREERDLTICIALDGSFSTDAGTGAVSRRLQARSAALLLAFAAGYANCGLGAVLFDGSVQSVYAPRSGKQNIFSIARALERFEPASQGSALSEALRDADVCLRRSAKRSGGRGLLIIISDFRVGGYERALDIVCRQNDVLAVRVTDPCDAAAPAVGFASFRDPETGRSCRLATHTRRFASAWLERNEESLNFWRRLCVRKGAVPLLLSTEEDPLSSLLRFFSGERAP